MIVVSPNPDLPVDIYILGSIVVSLNFEVNNSCHYGVISIDNTVDPYKAKDINNIYIIESEKSCVVVMFFPKGQNLFFRFSFLPLDGCKQKNTKLKKC
jgi:hypothetical protein